MKKIFIVKLLSDCDNGPVSIDNVSLHPCGSLEGAIKKLTSIYNSLLEDVSEDDLDSSVTHRLNIDGKNSWCYINNHDEDYYTCNISEVTIE